WTNLGTALALPLAGVKWAASDDEAAVAPAQSSRAAAPGEARGGAEPVPPLDLDRLRRAPHERPRADPFAQKRWTVATLQPPRPAAPPPPRAPQAPPLPFTYIGHAVEAGQVTVFLTRGENSYVARAGATLDGTYRVERVDAGKVVFTYLPLGTRQELVLGPAK
ncbi:MAG: hypothetical protein KJ025_20235, partial [Burkholderiales bacterium]|nr:hypothetical protein [Burkholderiales bacterium]